MKMEVTPSRAGFLKKADPELGKIIDRVGLLSIESNGDVFSSLVECIIGQMLSNKAAATIQKRFDSLVDNLITPESILWHDDEDLRNIGLSYAKARAIRGLAASVKDGSVRLDRLDMLSDEQVLAELTKIKGIGRWTAEMVATFTLGRMDIFSYDDLALTNSIMRVHNYKTLSKKRFASLKKRYSPYASLAALYYYRLGDEQKK